MQRLECTRTHTHTYTHRTRAHVCVCVRVHPDAPLEPEITSLASFYLTK